MPFEKTIPSEIMEYKIFNTDSTEELMKVASDVDFPEGFEIDPDFLYIWVRIVSSGEAYGPNNNGDYFPEEELVEYWETFKSGHAFKDHKNKSVSEAIGRIVSVRWNDVMKCVEILKGIDKKRAPEIARGYAKAYLHDVSMGCRVPYTQCSVCGNVARRRSEFCDHVKYNRMKYLGNGERVYEINFKPKFHDSSTVLKGAERVAKAFYIVNPENAIEPAFRKAASDGIVDTYIRISDPEMQKVASYQEQIHPMLREGIQKEAAAEPSMMRKIAELEKQLTGKLINLVSEQGSESLEPKKQMLEIIKFLTEKRLGKDSLINIAHSLKEVAKENHVSQARAFSTLIGVAELMGIEFFPSELHTILTHMTDGSLVNDMNPGESIDDEVYPHDFAKGMNKAVTVMENVRSFDDPGGLINLYNEAAHRPHEITGQLGSFLDSVVDGTDTSFEAPVHMVRVIKKVLNPMVPVRSYDPHHLYPRLSVVLGGHRPIIGDAQVRRDFDMLTNPTSLGDLIGSIAYSSYEKMRPRLIGTKLVKLALEADDFLSKTAAEEGGKKPTPHIGFTKKKKPGLGVVPLALGAVPLAYGASAYQKSRRENGRFLDDKENFMADHPGVIAGGAVLAGKPLSRKVAEIAPQAKKILKAPFIKESNEREFDALVKIADSLPTGEFNAFEDKEVLKRYMGKTAATGEQATAVKLSALFSVGGMDKEAYDLMNFYNISKEEVGNFLKVAANYVDEEMTKAAEDFTNNMLLSVIGDTNPLSRTLPGRAVDAFVFKKLGEVGQKPKKQEELKSPTVTGGVQ